MSSAAKRSSHFAMDREHVVGVPELVGPIALADQLDLVGDVLGRTAAMRAAIDRMAAPVAGVGAPARGDERNRTDTVMGLPRRQILLEIDRRAVGKGLRIEIADLLAGGGRHHLAVVASELDAGQCVEPGQSVPAKMRDQRLERLLALAGNDDVGAARRDIPRHSSPAPARRARRSRPPPSPCRSA